MFRFAHLSDPHLSDLHGVRLRQLLNKRLLGYLSWRRRRRHEHRPEMLDALLGDLHALAPDHVVVTGDLTHIALPHEFREALRWLERVGDAGAVTVVPGNHDSYVRTSWTDALGLWAPYMRGDGVLAQGPAEALFPLLRRRGPVAFIGLSSAVPTAPFLATGRLGRGQLERLAALLAQLGDDVVKVLLLHHPPVAGDEKWRKRLVDAPALARVLADLPVDLLLHGHSHQGLYSELDCGGRRIPVFGIASASAEGLRSGDRSTYNLVEVAPGAAGWDVRISARSCGAGGRSFQGQELARLPVARERASA